MDDLLAAQDGVITAAQALHHLTPKALRHRVTSGRWQQPHRAVYVAHNGPLGAPERRWIAVLGTGCPAVLAGLSAAEAAGLRGFDPAAVHVLVPGRRRPRAIPAGVVVHRTEAWHGSDLLPAGRPPRTKTARSVVDAAQWARTDDDARAAVAAAFQQRWSSSGTCTGCSTGCAGPAGGG